MTGAEVQRGGAPVGHIADLTGVEAATVIYMRLWCEGAEGQAVVSRDLVLALGGGQGAAAVHALDGLFSLCAEHGRRPIMRHAVSCKCLGADESCFAHFIGAAAEGDRSDAMMIATLLVRPDFAPLVTALATDWGLALKRMFLAAPTACGLSPQNTGTVH